MNERHDTTAGNSVAGHVSGSIVQARDVTGPIIVGAATQRGPGLVSTAVPTGRMGHEVRGREPMLAELTELLRSTSGVVAVLHAAGGYGKTTTALALAQRVQEVMTVWWVDATSSTSLVEGLREVALLAGADEHAVRSAWAGDSSAPDLLSRALGAMREPWLLVLDNVDDTALLVDADGIVVDGRGWLRTPSGPGTILVTSRDGRATTWGRRTRLFRVGRLEDAESAAVLIDWAPSAGDHDAAVVLGRRLGGLPIALRLAGSYLAATSEAPVVPGWDAPRTFIEYGKAWESRFTEITAPDGGMRSAERRMLGRTWELSLDLLALRGQQWARPVLRLVSFLAAAPIPYQLLDASVLAESEMFAGITAARLVEALVGLTGLGLLDHLAKGSAADGFDAVAVHPVVRDTNQHQADSVAAGEQYRWWCLRLLEQGTRNTKHDDPTMWPWWRALVPHCVQLIQDASRAKTEQDDHALVAASVANRTGAACHAIGLVGPAALLFDYALAVRQHILGPEHPDALDTRHNLARQRRDRGDLAGAETEFRDVLAAQRRVLGPEHPDTLVTRHNLARMLRRRADLAGAEREFRDILAVRQRVLGPEHPATLVTRNNLAYVRRERGDLAGAEAEFRAVLAIRRRLLGAEHPDTLATWHNLAGTLWHQGKLASAEKEFQDVLSVRAEVLGREHFQTLITRNKLAAVRRARGDLAGAEAEFAAVLAIRRRVLGAGHPDTLATRQDLASLLHQRGDVAGAESEYRDILHIGEAVLDGQHRLLVAVRAALDAIRTNGSHP